MEIKNEKTITLELWKSYTDTELQEKGEELSQAVIEAGEVEARKKATADQFKREMEGVEGRMHRLSREISRKGIETPTKCMVQYHQPRTAFKRTVRLDTGELVREEQMTPVECQENLFEARDMEELNKIYGETDKPSEAQPEA